MKKIITVICTATLLSSGLAFAASHSNTMDDPIASRKAEMKKVGGAMGTLVKMAKGKMDFDAAAALASLKTMNEVASNFGELFPDGSQTGGKTTVSPKIWSDASGFTKSISKFEADTVSAIANAPTDQASVGATLGLVGANCKACHQTYRIKK
ncbi:MAG: cytochrome c [Rhizobiales bacterium]|nr:cytochrome c [Hyphomicrobiales bacterium]